MADVSPPPSTPPPVVSTTSAPQTAVAHNPPSDITSLPVGASLEGVVTSQYPQSTLVGIETHLGKLLLQSTADLELGNYLHLILQKKSPSLQFIIKNNLASPSAQIGTSELQKLTTIGPTAQSPSSAMSANPRVIAQNISAEGQVKVDIGVIVRATLLTASTNEELSNLSAVSASKSLPNGLLHAGDRILQSLKNGFAQVFTGNGGRAAATKPDYLQSSVTGGSKLDVRITDILSPANRSVHSHSRLSLKPGHAFLGKVTSHLPSGFPVTDTPIGRLVLETATHIAKGSRLSMEFISHPQAEVLNHRSPVNQLPPLLLRDLPALTDTVDFIEKLPSEVRVSVPTPAIPRADSQLTSTLLFFLSALKVGNASTWLPDQTQAFLTAGKARIFLDA